jgi:Zn-dependent oligopeptidase
MLENWPWQEKILDLISGHYQNPNKKLAPETLKKMILARDYQQGFFYTRQLTLALTDMAYHTATTPVDTAATYNRIFKELTGITPIEGGHFPASFGHLMGGYDAGYYGYLWSLVYATDLFTAFENSDILDPQTGKKYRELILEKGDMEEIQPLLAQFLGRAPNSDAFFKKLHVGPAPRDKTNPSPRIATPTAR